MIRLSGTTTIGSRRDDDRNEIKDDKQGSGQMIKLSGTTTIGSRRDDDMTCRYAERMNDRK